MVERSDAVNGPRDSTAAFRPLKPEADLPDCRHHGRRKLQELMSGLGKSGHSHASLPTTGNGRGLPEGLGRLTVAFTGVARVKDFDTQKLAHRRNYAGRSIATLRGRHHAGRLYDRQ